MLLLSINNSHVGLSISSVNSGLSTFDSLSVLWDGSGGRRVLELLALIGFGLKLDGRSVRRSSLSSNGSGILLVIEVLSPCLPVLLTVSDGHVFLSVSSVNSGLS